MQLTKRERCRLRQIAIMLDGMIHEYRYMGLEARATRIALDARLLRKIANSEKVK